MDKQILKAEKRKIVGRKVKILRKEGILPANVYGKKVKSESVQVKLSEFEKVFKAVGSTGLVELVVDNKKRPVLVHDIQVDPVTDNFLHADFLQVDLKQKVTAFVPVELTGEAPAEKLGLGTVVQHLDEVEVEALPTDLPEKFEVDLSKLEEVDAAIFVKDLGVDTKKVTIQNEPDQMIAKVEPLRKEEEVVAPVEEEAAEGEEVEGESDEEKKEGEGVSKGEGGQKEERKETQDKKAS